MQAVARVTRVFRDKPGGPVVDYLGLAHELKAALATCCGLFYGFDWSHWTTGTSQERLALLPAAQEHIPAQENGGERLLQAVSDLSRAFALAVPHEEALASRDDAAFFQAGGDLRVHLAAPR